MLAVLVIKVLVVIFGWIEVGEFGDFGDNRRLELIGLLERLNYILSDLFLFLRMVKNGRTVLGAYIVALTIKCGGVMGLEKDFENSLVWDD
jgi:hypothetical protein